MNDQPVKTGPDYSASLYLPQTHFPMRAGLPKKEPEILARWAAIDLYGKLREAAEGKPKFVLHDGPPYANGHIHIGHALNKILKDLVTRTQQLLGRDSNYVPGWDCHGLPIEWKIEEENYRSKGKPKPDFSNPEAMIAFRQECRAYAEKWLEVQREEFIRLGVTGDWANPYRTMSFDAEAQIAREILKFAENGLLYRGSKPVMWSVVEKTALAEAEVEYEDYVSDTVWVAFPVKPGAGLDGAHVVIWTTTPWTMPGNRAISFNNKISYGLYELTGLLEGSHAVLGKRYVLADKLADDVFAKAKANGTRLQDVAASVIASLTCAHPLAAHGYTFDVPLLDGDHVTDDAGTGFVHTAPGHGRDDFEIWMNNGRQLAERGIDTRIPTTVNADGFLTTDAPGFTGKRVIDDKGAKGDANEAIIKALIDAGNLVARGRLKHQYPHSWRSKKPIIFRNTPQWFIAMDKGIASAGDTLRHRALNAIQQTQWVPASGENRINGMIANRPDWVVSRQRAWGVPIAVFVKKGSHDILVDKRVNARIAEAFELEGADAWFSQGAAARFLAPEFDPADYEKIDDVLDVWFDSGSTHAFTLESPLQYPLNAPRWPHLHGIHRKIDGGPDEVMYLEGSDQHRGWFHSSLLESCGTRGRAPFDVVLTHGFTLDGQGRKMSKSLGNTIAPQTVIAEMGADNLRLWVASVDFSDDQRISKDILKSVTDTYFKLRNTLRWMLGTLAHFGPEDSVARHEMPELERLMLHRIAELDALVRKSYAEFDFNRVLTTLSSVMITELSAFYFDIRKDALYCDPPSSVTRRAALTVIDALFDHLTIWLSPILAFTCEEAWLERRPSADGSVHLQLAPQIPADWLDEPLAAKWRQVRQVRRAVTGALEIERAHKRIGSSLEAAPLVYVQDPGLLEAIKGVDMAEICITSGIAILPGEGGEDAFRLDDLATVAVVPARARGAKCARSWKYFDPATADPEFPDVTPRDAQALRELRALGRWA